MFSLFQGGQLIPLCADAHDGLESTRNKLELDAQLK